MIIPAEIVKKLNITKPTLLVDKAKTKKNIEKMARRAKKNNVRFCPHFKTHQASHIADWFKEYGVDKCAVSSVDMAEYFINNGWNNVVIAFPFNQLQLKQVEKLTEKAKLGLTVDSLEMAEYVIKHLENDVDIWIEVDAGYDRSGIKWDEQELLLKIATEISKSDKIFKGVIFHAGHTYGATDEKQIRNIFEDTKEKLNKVKDMLYSNGISGCEVSIGDTPACSVIDNLEGVDEIRPGNFVFYDLMQLEIGSCGIGDISIALACPVIHKNAVEGKIVLYGGAVHFSKEFIGSDEENRTYGYPAIFDDSGNWNDAEFEAPLARLSQEHGIIITSKEIARNVKVGDVIAVLPVHSCLTAANFNSYTLLDGETVSKFQNLP